MFTVNTSKGNFKIGFEHFNEEGSISRYTVATLYNMDKEIIRREVAACAPEDNFNRNIGRKVSLARLLRPFTREDRTSIWTEYFNIHKRKSN